MTVVIDQATQLRSLMRDQQAQQSQQAQGGHRPVRLLLAHQRPQLRGLVNHHRHKEFPRMSCASLRPLPTSISSGTS